MRPLRKDFVQIALTNLTARRLLLIIRLLLPSSLLLLSKLRASTITIKRTGSYGRSSAASLAGGGIKIKACPLPVEKLWRPTLKPILVLRSFVIRRLPS